MLLHPWDFPGKSTGVDCHFLLQKTFLTRGSNPGLLHFRQRLYRLSHKEICQPQSPSSSYLTPFPPWCLYVWSLRLWLCALTSMHSLYDSCSVPIHRQLSLCILRTEYVLEPCWLAAVIVHDGCSQRCKVRRKARGRVLESGKPFPEVCTRSPWLRMVQHWQDDKAEGIRRQERPWRASPKPALIWSPNYTN